MKKNAPVVISLGGSLVVPDHVDGNFLKKFHRLIIDRVRKGDRFIIIVGGGKTARRYQYAARVVSKLTDVDVDWIGIHSTRLNAHLLRTIFREHAYVRLITSMKDINPHIRKPIIIGAGFKPGSSTDYRAVLLAKAFGAKTILNLSNIDWVYTKDPKKYKSAKRIIKIRWKDFRKMFGTKWDPGANVPFDPVASKWAERWGVSVTITRGTDFKNLNDILDGRSAKGTVVGPA
jgi:uridylate kinase